MKNTQAIGKYTPLKEALNKKLVNITETEGTANNTTPAQNTNERTRNNINTEEIQQSVNELNPPTQQRRRREVNPQQRSTGTSATVNTLFVENLSKDTVFLMAGEVVQGGKQDRVIAQDMILAPNSGKTALPVFCVESGRWTYKSGEKDNFDKYYGGASMKLRGVVDTKQNQSEVWSEVSRSNEKNKVNSQTSAYTVQATSEEFQKNKKDYLAYFQDKFKNDANVVGVIVVTGKRVVGCDMFASPALFQSQYSTLLDSYINEAVTDGEAVNITQAEVTNYMDNLLKEDVGQEKRIIEKGKVFKNANRKLHISTY